MAKRKTYDDGEVFTRNGRVFRVKIKPDDDADAPWDREDDHGPVRGWDDKDSKRPGERILNTDRGQALFYDFQEATKIAKRDGWGCPHCKGETIDGKFVRTHTHKTAGEMRACAVQSDYDLLRRYCTGDWHYVGIIVELLDCEDEDDADDADVINEDSCWGFESDCEEYLAESIEDIADGLVITEARLAKEAADRQEALESSVSGLGLA
jgi:hypothetical protein